MAHTQQPAVRRPRADQDAINATKAAVLQVEPPPVTEPSPLPDKNTNPLPE